MVFFARSLARHSASLLPPAAPQRRGVLDLSHLTATPSLLATRPSRLAASLVGDRLSVPIRLCVLESPLARYVTLLLPLVAPRRVGALDVLRLAETPSPLATRLSRPAAQVAGARLSAATRLRVPEPPLRTALRTLLLKLLVSNGCRVVAPHYVPSAWLLASPQGLAALQCLPLLPVAPQHLWVARERVHVRRASKSSTGR